MSIFTTVRSWFGEKRSESNLSDFFFTHLYPHINTFSGKAVTPDTALTYGAVYSGIKIISETFASLPISTFETKANNRKEEKPEHQVALLLSRSPNRWQTPMEFKEMMQAHTLLRGNGYAQIVYKNGRPSELIPLHPGRVRCEMRPTGIPFYKYQPPDSGSIIEFDFEEILHIRNITLDGLHGISVIAAARESIGLGMAQQEHGARLFGQGAKPAGILEHPGTLKKESADRMKESWKSAYGGIQNSHSVAVLEEGMTFKQIELTSEDSQWLESRKFQVEEIARFLRIPLHKLNSLERATFSNIEEQNIEFVQDTMTPWCIRWQESIQRDLLWNPRDRRISVKVIVQELLKGDLESRYNSYAVGRQNGWLSANDIRELEGMNPIGPEGDVYWAPVNMTNSLVLEDAERLMSLQDDNNAATPELNEQDDEANEPAKQGVGEDQIAGVEGKSDTDKNYTLRATRDALSPMFHHLLRRCLHKESVILQKSIRRSGVRVKFLDEFYEKHGGYIVDELRSAIVPYLRLISVLDEEEIDKKASVILDEFAGSCINISQEAIRSKIISADEDKIADFLTERSKNLLEDSTLRAYVNELFNTAQNHIGE